MIKTELTVRDKVVIVDHNSDNPIEYTIFYDACIDAVQVCSFVGFAYNEAGLIWIFPHKKRFTDKQVDQLRALVGRIAVDVGVVVNAG